MKITFGDLAAAAFIAGVTGMAIADVGEMMGCGGGTYGWSLPLSIFGITATPYLVYRLAPGKKDE